MNAVRIGDSWVGEGHPCYVVAEVGINHQGSVDVAKKLIDAAAKAGCNAVKFQKRTIEVIYTAEELAQPRVNTFGPTNGDLKRGLEFNKDQYLDLAKHCDAHVIEFFASPWDIDSAAFLENLEVPCYKIASPCLTDDSLLSYIRMKGKPVILSTGMSTLEEIDHAVSLLDRENLIILHCTSTYPTEPAHINLKCIQTLRDRYHVPVGLSCHEKGVPITAASVVLETCMIERHITLDRTMWGSDQAASIEPRSLERLVRDIRVIEKARGDGHKYVYSAEIPIKKKLRRIG